MDACPTCHRQRGEPPGTFRIPNALNPLPGLESRLLCWDAFHDEANGCGTS